MKVNSYSNCTLNQSQREYLTRLLGQQGHFYLVIKHHEGKIDLGTRILYLERAITNDCIPFIKSLDKLYQSGLPESEMVEHITLIGILKTINDLCFDNETNNEKKEPSRGQSPLTALGEATPETIQAAVQTMVSQRLAELRALDDGVSGQMENRKRAEVTLMRNSLWRSIFHLPLSQLDVYAPTLDHSRTTPYLQLLLEHAKPGTALATYLPAMMSADRQQLKDPSRGSDPAMAEKKLQEFLTPWQFRALPSTMKQLLLDNVEEAVDLQVYSVGFEDFRVISEAVLRSILHNMHGLKRFVFMMQIPFNYLKTLPADTLAHCLKYSLEIMTLKNYACLTLEKYLALDSNDRSFMRRHYVAIARFSVVKFHYSELLALPADNRLVMVNQHEKIITFLRKTNVIFSDICKLSLVALQEMLAETSMQAMSKTYMRCLANAKKVTGASKQPLDATDRVAQLRRDTGASAEQAEAYLSIITKLAILFNVTANDILTSPPDLQRELINHSEACSVLINGENPISFKQLVKLTVGQLTSLCVAPLSDDAETLLASLQSEQRVEMTVLAFFEKHTPAVINLTVNLKIPFEAILELDEEKRTLVLTKHKSVEQVLTAEEPLTFENLTCLDTQDLQSVLEAPTSPLAQDILQALTRVKGASLN